MFIIVFFIYRNSSDQRKSNGNPATNVAKDTHVAKNSPPPVQKKAKVLMPKQSAIDQKLKALTENNQSSSSKTDDDDVELLDENPIRSSDKSKNSGGFRIFCGICDEEFGNQEIAKAHMKSQYGINTNLTVRMKMF